MRAPAVDALRNQMGLANFGDALYALDTWSGLPVRKMRLHPSCLLAPWSAGWFLSSLLGLPTGKVKTPFAPQEARRFSLYHQQITSEGVTAVCIRPPQHICIMTAHGVITSLHVMGTPMLVMLNFLTYALSTSPSKPVGLSAKIL